MNLQQLLEETESLEATQSDIEQIENELFYLADSITLYNFKQLSFAERKAILIEILQGLEEPPAQIITVDKSNFCLPSTKEAADAMTRLGMTWYDPAMALAGGSFSLKPLHETISEAIQQERNDNIQ